MLGVGGVRVGRCLDQGAGVPGDAGMLGQGDAEARGCHGWGFGWDDPPQNMRPQGSKPQGELWGTRATLTPPGPP